MEQREKELRLELKTREKAFISDQLKRDNELLKIMKEREDAMEHNLMQKVDAFGYLYKEHHKEIKQLIEKRDRDMEATLNCREKLWTESLDMVNNNLFKMYSAQGEFERTLNSIGQRQDDLIKKMALSMEWSVFNKEESNKDKRPPIQFPEFSLSSTGYKFQLVNLNLPNKNDRRKKLLTLLFFPYFSLCN